MEGNILDQLADCARVRVQKEQEETSLDVMREKAWQAAQNTPEEQKFLFEKALSGPGIHFICECKKASPSKGLIAPKFPYLEIARDYEAAGASAISCLTEPKWFLGKNEYLKEIAETVSIPVLR